MIRWKDSCRFDDLHAAIVLALIRCDTIYIENGIPECWVTSANDSTHTQKSKHYDGRAFDLRVHNIEPTQRKKIATQIRSALGAQYTVIYENPTTRNAHFHVQFNGTH